MDHASFFSEATLIEIGAYTYQTLQVLIRVHFYFATQRTVVNQGSAASLSIFYVTVKAVVTGVHFTTDKPSNDQIGITKMINVSIIILKDGSGII